MLWSTVHVCPSLLSLPSELEGLILLLLILELAPLGLIEIRYPVVALLYECFLGVVQNAQYDIVRSQNVYLMPV